MKVKYKFYSIIFTKNVNIGTYLFDLVILVFKITKSIKVSVYASTAGGLINNYPLASVIVIKNI